MQADSGKQFEDYADAVDRELNVHHEDDVPPPPTLSTISAVELQHKDIPPVKWLVQDLIPAGLTILASPPKYGKSWMSLDLCLSLSTGADFLGYRCNRAGTLYLALEDSERRLKTRMNKLLCGRQAPPGFDFATTAPTLSTGLLDALEGYILEHRETGLIILDTLAKVRDMGGGRDVYGKDYADVGALKKFADAHNIALLIIHHLRKMADNDDVFNRIGASSGITGASDTMMTLTKKKRTDENAELSVTGRDVQENDLILRFDKDTCRWVNEGDVDTVKQRQAAEQYAENPIVKTIHHLLGKYGSWSGSSTELLKIGEEVTGVELADSGQALTSKLKELADTMREYEAIGYTRVKNGSGGGRHKFFFSELPTTQNR